MLSAEACIAPHRGMIVSNNRGATSVHCSQASVKPYLASTFLAVTSCTRSAGPRPVSNARPACGPLLHQYCVPYISRRYIRQIRNHRSIRPFIVTVGTLVSCPLEANCIGCLQGETPTVVGRNLLEDGDEARKLSLRHPAVIFYAVRHRPRTAIAPTASRQIGRAHV